jgi:hypothetical protein
VLGPSDCRCTDRRLPVMDENESTVRKAPDVRGPERHIGLADDVPQPRVPSQRHPATRGTGSESSGSASRDLDASGYTDDVPLHWR